MIGINSRLALRRLPLVVPQQTAQRQADYEAAVGAPEGKRNLEVFFSDLPGDLKRLLRAWLKERGFDKLKVPRKARP